MSRTFLPLFLSLPTLSLVLTPALVTADTITSTLAGGAWQATEACGRGEIAARRAGRSTFRFI